jgi:hypothetical protein
MSGTEPTNGRARRLVFPQDRSMGVLSLRNADEKYEIVGDAKGLVWIPAKKWLKLVIGGEAAKDLSPLVALQADDLQELGLDSTSVTDTQLANLRGLRELLALGMSSTGVGNLGLMKLAVLSSLQTLNLLGTKVDDQGMKLLPYFSSLKHLDLTRTSVGDASLEYLDELPNLRCLALRGTAVSDVGMPCLRSSLGIRALWLGGTRVTGSSLFNLASLKDLEILDLSRLSVGVGLEVLAEQAKLRWINLRRTDTSDDSLKGISGLKLLTWLDLAYTPVSGRGVLRLADLPSLAHLSLQGSRILDSDLAALGACSNLLYLNLSATAISADGIQWLRNKLPGCHVEGDALRG